MTQKKEKWKNEKSFKKCQNDLEPRVVPQVPQNKWFGEGTKRAFPRWWQFLIKIWSKMTLSIFKVWWENQCEIKNSGFQQQWIFRPILTETYILLYALHHLFESVSFKKPSRSAAAVHKVHSYLGEKQIVKMHSLPVTTQEINFWRQVLDENAIDFPKSHVLKRLVKILICLLYTSPSPRD